MSNVRIELRSTLRGLSRARTLAGAAVICLALGIGATAAIFTAVDAALSAVAAVAILIPARRASTVDPLVAMRSE